MPGSFTLIIQFYLGNLIVLSCRINTACIMGNGLEWNQNKNNGLTYCQIDAFQSPLILQLNDKIQILTCAQSYC